MNFTNDTLTESSDDMADAETRMRLALNAVGTPNTGQRRGGEHQSRPRHQFVRDGDVPVVMLNSSRKDYAGSNGPSQMSRLETELYSERAAREKAERQLQQTTTRMQSMQTQLTHAKMALAESGASLSEARERSDALQQEMRQLRISLERAHREQAEELQELRDALAKAREEKAEARKASMQPKPRVKPVSRKNEAETDESEPVQWWIPGWKDQYRNRYASKDGDQ